MDLDVLFMILLVTLYLSLMFLVINFFLLWSNQLKYFNLAESNLDGTLSSSALSSNQTRYAIETCYPCANGTWADLTDQRFDRILYSFEF